MKQFGGCEHTRCIQQEAVDAVEHVSRGWAGRSGGSQEGEGVEQDAWLIAVSAHGQMRPGVDPCRKNAVLSNKDPLLKSLGAPANEVAG